MLRAALGLVSLLVMAVVAAMYFTTAQPELQSGQYQKIESQANAAAALMARDPQLQVDAANGISNAPPATNAPASGN